MPRKSSIARRGFGRIERRDSGRYRAAYTGPDGRLYRALTTFDAKEDAVAWLANRRAEIQMEVWAPDAAARGASRSAAPTMRGAGQGDHPFAGPQSAPHDPRLGGIGDVRRR